MDDCHVLSSNCSGCQLHHINFRDRMISHFEYQDKYYEQYNSGGVEHVITLRHGYRYRVTWLLSRNSPPNGGFPAHTHTQRGSTTRL